MLILTNVIDILKCIDRKKHVTAFGTESQQNQIF